MKLFNYILMAGALATAFASCSREEDDLFSESASKRVDNNVIAYTNLLESSSEGWMLNYYAGTDDAVYAGVVHTMRFKDGVVAVRSQAATDPTTEYTSLYQVKAEQEAMLTFDTYNDVFHYWSEPLGTSAVNGYKGDYEFTFKRISADQDTIILKGKRYGRYCELVRLKENGAGYMSTIVDMADRLSVYPHPKAIIGNDSIDAVIAGGTLSYTPDGEDEAVEIPYVPTKTGLRLYKEVTVGGKSFRECTLDTATYDLAAVGVDVKFPVILPEGYRQYDELLGNYVAYLSTGTAVNITVTTKLKGQSYTISGMTACGGTIDAEYVPATGSFAIYCGQYTGMYNNTYYCYLCGFDGSYVYWSTSLALLGTNSTEGDLVITFSSNDSSAPINSFLEYAFSSTTMSSSTAKGTVRRFAQPLVFTKK